MSFYMSFYMSFLKSILKTHMNTLIRFSEEYQNRSQEFDDKQYHVNNM